MDRLENYITFLMAKAYQQTNKRAKEVLQPFGVTPTQYAVLTVLWERDGRSGAELASRVVLDSAAMTGLLDRMENSGLITRKADRYDRRVNRIWLTDHGAELGTTLVGVIADLDRDIRAQLDGDPELLLKALRQLGKVG